MPNVIVRVLGMIRIERITSSPAWKKATISRRACRLDKRSITETGVDIRKRGGRVEIWGLGREDGGRMEREGGREEGGEEVAESAHAHLQNSHAQQKRRDLSAVTSKQHTSMKASVKTVEEKFPAPRLFEALART